MFSSADQGSKISGWTSEEIETRIKKIFFSGAWRSMFDDFTLRCCIIASSELLTFIYVIYRQRVVHFFN